jgi:hypothetical protein
LVRDLPHSFDMILSAILLRLLLASSPLNTSWTEAPPTSAMIARTPSPPFPSDVPSRWDGAGLQWLAGTAGGAVGALGGGLLGGLVGAGMGSGSEGFGQLGALLLGAAVGGTVGGVTLEALSVKLASSDAYPSRSAVPAAVGSVMGIAVGILVVNRVAASSPTHVDWGVWPGFATIVGCSSLGAVLFDRVVAVPRSVSLAPWSPLPGANGMRISLAF